MNVTKRKKGGGLCDFKIFVTTQASFFNFVQN